MAEIEKQRSSRWGYLVLGVVLLIFLGLIYAWSVFVTPLENEFGWVRSQTSLTFSISMTMFCIGGLVSGVLSSRKGPRFTLVLCAIFLLVGFVLASRVTTLMGIYIAYGVFCGFGVGMGYNATISSFIKWFPDKQGLVSGILLMGFGLGGMLLGTLGARLINEMGWRVTFVIFGVAFGVIMLAGALLLRLPKQEFLESLDAGKKKIMTGEELDFKEMLKRKNFWFYFVWAILLSAAGLSVISGATTYAVFLGADLARAAAIGGLVSIFNGAGRVIFGFMFDKKGYKVTMLSVVILFIISSGVLMASSQTESMTILIMAYIVLGLSYGGITPTNSAFIASFFGNKNYPLNFSIINLNLIVASYLGPYLAGVLQTGSGAYLTTFISMLIFSVISLFVTFAVKQPKQ